MDQFTTKELLIHIWDEVKELRRETNGRFTNVEGRIDSLESEFDKGYWPRTFGRTVLLTLVAALASGVVGALFALRGA